MVDQEEPESALERRGEKGPNPHRRTLELARTDVVRRLESASNENLRQMLKRALASLDDQIKRMDTGSPRRE